MKLSLLIICVATSQGLYLAQDDPSDNVGEEGVHDNDDMMAADRVMAVDEGKEAFQDMMSAVNSADERVNGISDDLTKTLEVAVSDKIIVANNTFYNTIL